MVNIASTVQYSPLIQAHIEVIYKLSGCCWPTRSLSLVPQTPVTSVLCQGSEVRWLQWKHMKEAVWLEHKVYYPWRIIDGRCEMTSCR